MNPYTELYKSLNNSDLLWIINNPVDYQPLAIEAAAIELVERQLTIEELAIANKENEIQENRKQAKIEKNRALENILKRTIFLMGDIIKRPPSKRKIKVIVSIIFSVMFLFQTFSLFGLIKFMFTNDNAVWDLSMVIYFLLLLALPTGLFLFWMRKKIGWLILSAYVIYSASCSIILFLEWAFIRYPEDPFIHNLFPRTWILPSVFKIFFFVGMLWAMCRNDVRSDYRIGKKTLFLSIGLSVSLTALLYFSHLLV